MEEERRRGRPAAAAIADGIGARRGPCAPRGGHVANATKSVGGAVTPVHGVWTGVCAGAARYTGPPVTDPSVP